MVVAAYLLRITPRPAVIQTQEVRSLKRRPIQQRNMHPDMVRSERGASDFKRLSRQVYPLLPLHTPLKRRGTAPRRQLRRQLEGDAFDDPCQRVAVFLWSISRSCFMYRQSLQQHKHTPALSSRHTRSSPSTFAMTRRCHLNHALTLALFPLPTSSSPHHPPLPRYRPFLFRALFLSTNERLFTTNTLETPPRAPIVCPLSPLPCADELEDLGNGRKGMRTSSRCFF